METINLIILSVLIFLGIFVTYFRYKNEKKMNEEYNKRMSTSKEYSDNKGDS